MSQKHTLLVGVGCCLLIFGGLLMLQKGVHAGSSQGTIGATDCHTSGASCAVSFGAVVTLDSGWSAHIWTSAGTSNDDAGGSYTFSTTLNVGQCVDGTLITHANPWTSAPADRIDYGPVRGCARSTADTTPPTVSITSPINGATVQGQVTVTVNASDTQSPIGSVEFWVDGVRKSTDGIAPYGFAWDTTAVANGSHTLKAVAIDTANNVGESSPITVTVSNGSAITSVTLSVNPTTVVLGTTPNNTATWTGSSNPTGLDAIWNGTNPGSVNIGDVPVTDAAGQQMRTNFSLPLRYDCSTLGTYTRTLKVRDAAGNTRVSSPAITFSVTDPNNTCGSTTVNCTLAVDKTTVDAGGTVASRTATWTGTTNTAGLFAYWIGTNVIGGITSNIGEVPVTDVAGTHLSGNFSVPIAYTCGGVGSYQRQVRYKDSSGVARCTAPSQPMQFTVTDTNRTCTSGTVTCGLKVNGSAPTAAVPVTVGQKLTWSFDSNPTGLQAYWHGTNFDGSPVSDAYAGITNLSFDANYTCAHRGTWTRSLHIAQSGNHAACTTNTVTVNVTDPQGTCTQAGNIMLTGQSTCPSTGYTWMQNVETCASGACQHDADCTNAAAPACRLIGGTINSCMCASATARTDCPTFTTESTCQQQTTCRWDPIHNACAVAIIGACCQPNNSMQWATQQTASTLASCLGGGVTQIVYTTFFTLSNPVFMITFPNGTELNAGLLAQRYTNFARSSADSQTAAELGWKAPTSGGAAGAVAPAHINAPPAVPVSPGATHTLSGSNFSRTNNTVHIGINRVTAWRGDDPNAPSIATKSTNSSILAQLVSSDGTTLGFTVPPIPPGTYPISVENESGVLSNGALITVGGSGGSGGTTCTNPSPMPSGFAIPCPVLSVNPVTVSLAGSFTVNATKGTVAYIYRTIYISEAGQWKLFSNALAPANPSFPIWATTDASYTTTPQAAGLTTGNHWVASWDWTWDGTAQCWKGPNSSTCFDPANPATAGVWRIQRFVVQ